MTEAKALIEEARRLLDKAATVIEAETNGVLEGVFTPVPLIKHYTEVDSLVEDLREAKARLEKLVSDLSYKHIPDAFQRLGIKTLNVTDIGRVTIVYRWSASMIDKATGMAWLRSTGNQGLIQETVNAQTLAAFAKERALDGDDLPETIFRTSQSPHVSITRT